MNDYPRLTHEETLALIARAQAGDEYALEQVTGGNLALVKSIVKRYLRAGVEYDDLYQLGCMGLLKAVRNFDLTRELHFSTYAVPLIAGEIRRFLRDDGSVKVSRTKKELAMKAFSVSERLKKERGMEAGIEEVSRAMGVEVAELINALEAVRPAISIYEPIYDDDGSANATLSDRIPDTEDRISAELDSVMVKEMLSALQPRDRQLIMLRFFSHKTQTETANELGISQVQVSRLERRILSQLKAEYSSGETVAY